MQRTRWFSAVAGSGVVIGLLTYFREEKMCAKTSWTTNFTPSAKWNSNWDRRESTKPSKSHSSIGSGDSNKENLTDDQKEKQVLPTATRHLIFIRHGQYNLKGAKDIDRYLTPLGRSQADATGFRLKELGFNYNRMVQSTMTRAQETASIISKHLPHVPLDTCDLLCEGAPIPPEPPIGNWRSEAEFYEDSARIEAAFRKYFYRADVSQKTDSYEIFVCHANVIRYFVCRALQFPAEAWLRFSLHHGSLTWLAIRPSGRVTAYTIGDSGHLPSEKMTRA